MGKESELYVQCDRRMGNFEMIQRSNIYMCTLHPCFNKNIFFYPFQAEYSYFFVPILGVNVFMAVNSQK